MNKTVANRMIYTFYTAVIQIVALVRIDLNIMKTKEKATGAVAFLNRRGFSASLKIIISKYK